MVVFNFIQLGVINTFYNTFLETAQGYTPQAASSVTSVISLLSIVTIPLAGAISERVRYTRKKLWIAGSYAVFAIGLIGLSPCDEIRPAIFLRSRCLAA